MKKTQKSQISVYRVEPPEGYHRLGDFLEQSHSPYPSASMLCIKESNEGAGFPLLVKPIRYAKIWDDRGTGAKFGDLSFFRPVAPAGYVALGISYLTPSLIKKTLQLIKSNVYRRRRYSIARQRTITR